MKKHKLVGLLLLGLGVATTTGIVLNDAVYWLTYNPIAATLSLVSGIVLLCSK